MGLGRRVRTAHPRSARGDAPVGAGAAGVRRGGGRGAGPAGSGRAPGASRLAAAFTRRDLLRRHTFSGVARDGQGLPGRRPRLSRRISERARRSGEAGDGGGGRGSPGLVLRRGLRRHPLRWRHQRLRRSRAAAARRVSGRRDHRPRRAGQGAGGRRGFTLGAHPGRRPGPRPGGPVEGARAHDALLSAVVRVLHARWMGRDSRGRPLRDQADARGRHGRVDSRDHAGGRVGEPSPAGIGRGPQPGPHDDRLGGHPRRDHGGLGQGPAAATLQDVMRSRVRDVLRRRRRRPRDLTVRSGSRELPVARSGRSSLHRSGRRLESVARPRVRVRPSSGRRADAGRGRSCARARRCAGQGSHPGRLAWAARTR